MLNIITTNILRLLLTISLNDGQFRHSDENDDSDDSADVAMLDTIIDH